jgi:elongator complex protein 3
MSELTDTETVKKISREIIDYLMIHPNFPQHKITNLKGKFGKKYNYHKVIKNAQILHYANEEELEVILQLLKRRITRTISGVSIIAIMTKPLPCPGNCVYCPGQDSQPNEKVAQSYTGREPAAMRSIHYNYDSYKQVQSRIKDLEAIGHIVDKIELVCMGGTFLSAPVDYQEEFIKGAYEGVIERRAANFIEAKKIAETSKRRLIGLTIETRPDYCTEPYVDMMLNYGTTRVEIGIQTLLDDVYKKINRGHTSQDSINAIRIAKDAGLKINAHIMPNLPGSSYSKDLKMFELLYSSPNYRPDMLKIYPCVVIKGTQLYNWWKAGDFTPYSLDDLIDLLVYVKQKIPSYVRIQRIMRDIPAFLIEAGCKKSNLRQMIHKRLEDLNSKCSCIRCREYGIVNKSLLIDDKLFEDIKLYRYDYDASDGQEVFLSYENKKEDFLIAYLRIRKPSDYAHRPELNDGKTMIVREVKVVGELVPKDQKPLRKIQLQHRGYGKLLMENAEKIAFEDFDSKKLAVISGIGVRDWFYEIGYNLDGIYVSKPLFN